MGPAILQVNLKQANVFLRTTALGRRDVISKFIISIPTEETLKSPLIRNHFIEF